VTITILDVAGKDASISIKDRMNAEDVDRLIRDLARLRPAMIPEIATQPDINPDLAPEPVVALAARIHRSGACDLWIRDAGLGWIACQLPVEAVVILHDGFRRAVSSHPPSEPIVMTFDAATYVYEDW
jgi:hypothetical protein